MTNSRKPKSQRYSRRPPLPYVKYMYIYMYTWIHITRHTATRALAIQKTCNILAAETGLSRPPMRNVHIARRYKMGTRAQRELMSDANCVCGSSAVPHLSQRALRSGKKCAPEPSESTSCQKWSLAQLWCTFSKCAPGYSESTR